MKNVGTDDPATSIAPLVSFLAAAPTNVSAFIPPAPLAPAGMPAPAAVRRYPRWMPIALVGGFVMQIIAPYEARPTTLVGNVVADWLRTIGSVSVDQQRLAAQQQELAIEFGRAKADYADKIGKCSLSIVFGPEVKDVCIAAVDTYYVPVLTQMQKELDQVERQLRKR